MSEFRERIYGRYIEASSGSGTSLTAGGNDCRAPTMRYVIRSFFPPEKNAAILDLGCGHGTLIHYARQAGYTNIRGVDISEQQVQLAEEMGIDGISRGDLMETLRSSPSFSLDAVVTFDVIEHLSKNELMTFGDAVFSALKPGGRWIIHAPNGSSPFFGAIRYGDFTHEQVFTISSISQLLKVCGFNNIEFEECRPRIDGGKSLVRAILWRGIRLMYRLMITVETGDLEMSSIMSQNFYIVAHASKNDS